MLKFITSIYISCLLSITGTFAQVMITAETTNPLDCNTSSTEVNVVVENFSNIASMQFAMSWDTSVIQFQSVTDFFPVTDLFVPNQTQVAEGVYSFSWASFDLNGATLSDGDPIFTFSFDVTGDAGSSTLFDFISLPSLSIEVTSTVSGPLTIGTDVIFNPGTISIVDTQNPMISCPSDTTIFTGTGVVGGLAAMATDDCGVETLSYSLSGAMTGSGMGDVSGMTFPEGVTTVNYTATDFGGNSAGCSFNVDVMDTTSVNSGLLTFTPVINYDCTNDTITIDINVFNFDSITSMQYTIEWDTAVIDYIDNVANIAGFPPNDLFASDGLLVIVWSNPDPINNPEGITLADGFTLYTIQYVLDAGIQVPLVDFVSLPTLQIEITQDGVQLASNEYVFSDNVLNVNDSDPPTITNACPTDISVNNDAGMCGAAVSWTIPAFTDNCGIDTIIVSDTPGFFPVGVDTVTYTAIDIAGNSTVCSFTITVTDNEDPVITSCPGAINTNTDAGTCVAAMLNLGMPTATDNCGIASITSDAPTTFPVGMTTVTWTVTDVNGNVATCTQTVTITDNEDPVITSCPGAISTGTDAGVCIATISLGTPTATDNCGIASINSDAPTTFPVGTTTVTWTVTDVNGNATTCTQTVTVSDNENPTITCPTVDAFDADPGMCSAFVSNNLSPIVSDNCGVASVTYTITGATNASGNNDATNTTFNTGISTLTYEVTDVNGNTNSCSLIIQVNDNQLPSLSCPNDTAIFVPASTVDTMINNLAPVATDNCMLAGVTYDLSGGLGSGVNDASGTSFPLGTTTVTYTATDTAGNIATCSFNVTINPVTTELLGCPADQTENNDAGICGAVINGIAPTVLTDMANVDTLYYVLSGATSGEGPNDASGLTFNEGVTTVEYFITDIFSNMDTCNFTVTVNDTELPVWTNCPSSNTFQVNTDDCRAVVSWSLPIPSDNCGIEQIIPSHAPGDTFSLGTTTVSYAAIDTAGNIGVCTFDITVEDNEAPTLSCPGNITAFVAVGECALEVNWTAVTATDNCGSATVTCSSNPGDTFPIGVTTVSCTATDPSGNMNTCSFTVTVLDTLAPIPLNCPDTIMVDAVADCQAAASWVLPVFGDCPPVSISGSHSPGDVFPVGFTTVTYTAVDPSGNDTTCVFVVRVNDGLAPSITCPGDISVPSLTTSCDAQVTWTVPTATDDCDTDVMITSTADPGTTFSVGTTLVTYYAEDDAGNIDSCSFNVTVLDQFAPVFDCPDNAGVNVDGTVESDPSNIIISATPSSSCDSVAIEYVIPTATDNCAVDMIDLTSGQVSGGLFPIGTTSITYTAFDTSGNFNTCTFDIVVNPLGVVNVGFLPGDTLCEGETVQMVTDVVIPNSTFSWEHPATGWTSMENNPFRPNLTTMDSGPYFVTVTFPSGCTVVGSKNLLVEEIPTINATSNAPLCNGEDLELMAGVDVGAMVESYNWTGPDNFTSMEQNPVITNPTSINSGTYNLTVIFENGCEAITSTVVSINSVPVPEITPACAPDICQGSSCELQGTEYTPTPDFYNWEAIPEAGAGLPSDTESSAITITPTVPGTYIYNYWVEIGGCVSDTASTVIFVHGQPTAVADTFDVEYETAFNGSLIDNDVFTGNLGLNITAVTQPSNGTLTINANGTFEYTPDNGFIGLDQFIYEICYDCGDGGPLLCDNAVVNLNVSDNNEECIIPTVITPNGDKVNDALIINCLSGGTYSNNEIIIYNQWGDQVFTASPYQNNWEGTYEGKDLPDGTYYFLFRLDTNTELIKGFITIFR